jgi:hypothetical protein
MPRLLQLASGRGGSSSSHQTHRSHLPVSDTKEHCRSARYTPLQSDAPAQALISAEDAGAEAEGEGAADGSTTPAVLRASNGPPSGAYSLSPIAARGGVGGSSTRARRQLAQWSQSSASVLMSTPTSTRSWLHANRRAASFDVHELYCLLAVVLGAIGFGLSVVASSDEACGVVNWPATAYSAGMLTRWPSTISELNSDWDSARGRLFFGFMLSTAGLLFASRMPYELDTVVLEESSVAVDGEEEEEGEGEGEDDEPFLQEIVCCCVDCGPACNWSCAVLWSGASGCWLFDRLAALRSSCRSHIQRTCRADGDEVDALCCAQGACGCGQWALLHARAVVVPMGITFVALCPTVNFWTVELPGAQIVRGVHLWAAGVLFCGGTATEALRLYFLWCQSYSVGQRRRRRRRQRNEGSPSSAAGVGTARRDSCWRFLQHPSDYPEEGVGPLRPWIVGCLVLALAAFGWSILELSTIGEFRLRADRGDVLLSPVGTAFCPEPDFRYLEIRTVEQCRQATDRLRHHWNQSTDGVWKRSGAHELPMFHTSHGNVSSRSACLVSNGARISPTAYQPYGGARIGILAWGLMRQQRTRPLELLKPSDGSPPNTRCNLMNFNETAGGCSAHDAGDKVEYLARCPRDGHGRCDGHDILAQRACLPGGAPTTINSSSCCGSDNETFAAHCCASTCMQPQPYVWDPSLATANQRMLQSSGLSDQLDLGRFNCKSAVIDPLFIAACVCAPSDVNKQTCSWVTPEPAELRMRLFIQESLIAVLLMLNYAAISMEHVLRAPRPSPPVCQRMLLSLAYVVIPLCFTVLNFRLKATLSRHESTPLSWIWADGGSTIFLLQTRFNWVSGAGMVILVGCHQMRGQRQGIKMLTVAVVASILLWQAISLAHDINIWSVFWSWVVVDMTLALALFCMWQALVRRWTLRKICIISCGCWILCWILLLFAVLIGIASWAWIVEVDTEGHTIEARQNFLNAATDVGPMLTSVMTSALWQHMLLVALVCSCRVCGRTRLWDVLIPVAVRRCSLGGSAPVVPQSPVQPPTATSDEINP